MLIDSGDLYLFGLEIICPQRVDVFCFQEQKFSFEKTYATISSKFKH